MRIFEKWMATGSEYFVCQDSGLSQILRRIISNSEKILNDIYVIVVV